MNNIVWTHTGDPRLNLQDIQIFFAPHDRAMHVSMTACLAQIWYETTHC